MLMSRAGIINQIAYREPCRCPPNDGADRAEPGAVVPMVKAEVAGLVPGVMDAGENWQVAPAGRVKEVQASETVLLKPFSPVAIMVRCAGVPAGTVRALGLPLSPNCAAPITIWRTMADVLNA